MVNRQRRIILEQVQRLVDDMPLPMIEAFADRIEQMPASPHLPASQAHILRTLSHPRYRALAQHLLTAWQTEAPEITPQSIALALSLAAQIRRQGPEVELVWTGPNTDAIPVRHSEQALLHVIEAATQQLTLVSYAIYKIPRVCEALAQAAERGVSIRLIVEAPEESSRDAYDTRQALGNKVLRRASVYRWPLAHRAKDPNGKSGILHIKCAIADRHMLLVSSANLTEYAFTVNMELGVLLTGGDLPGQVETHFDSLIQAGTLVSDCSTPASEEIGQMGLDATLCR